MNSELCSGHLAFISSNGREEKRHSSFFNRPEALQIVVRAKELVLSGVEAKDIGIICLF